MAAGKQPELGLTHLQTYCPTKVFLKTWLYYSSMSKDKTSVLQAISNPAQTEFTDPGGCRRISIIDGMVAVN